MKQRRKKKKKRIKRNEDNLRDLHPYIQIIGAPEEEDKKKRHAAVHGVAKSQARLSD